MAEKMDTANVGSAFGTAGLGGTAGFGAAAAGANQDIAGLSFEQAREELSQVVARLEAGGEPLESALALWERGEALAAHCQVWLDGARQRFEAITGDSTMAGARTGAFEPEPF